MSGQVYMPKHRITQQLLSVLQTSDRYKATVRSCGNTKFYETVCDAIKLDFEVIGLCQYPAFDVRKIEPIEIIIGSGFSPIIFLERTDFPTVPHSTVHEDRQRSMCYSDQTFEELKTKLNGAFLLESINNWFVMTARNELHRPDQPLDPFFLGSTDVIVLDSCFLENIFAFLDERIIEGKRVLFETDEKEIGSKCYAILRLGVEPESSNVLHHIPKTLHELSQMFPEQNITARVKSFVSRVFEIQRDTKEYIRLFNQSFNVLLKCKVLIVMGIPLARTESSKPENYDVHVFAVNNALEHLLIDFGYAKEIVKKGKKARPQFVYHSEKDKDGQNTFLHMLDPHYSTNSRWAQALNGCRDEDYCDWKFVQIGVGALGSHLFENLLRSGIKRWTLIDNDRFWSHNIARHLLTHTEIGQYKATALVERAKTILKDADCKAINVNCFFRSVELSEALSNADVIIDASASIGVERNLALDVSTTARKISLFLNPAGTATIMLLEDREATIRLDLLEMQYYRELLLSSEFESHLQRTDTIAYSVSCRDISSVISGDNLALSGAICAKALKKYLNDNDAKITIWDHKEDTVVRTSMVADKWSEFQVDAWKICIREPLLNLLYEQRASSLPNETGGILIGSFDCERKILYIVHQIPPPNDSISSPNSFIRGCEDLPAEISRIKEITQDSLFYVGEWHSHPTYDTSQSADDGILFSAITSYNKDFCRPACMMIIGDDRKSLYIAK